MHKKYSVVIPIKDEAPNISHLINEVERVMEKQESSWEMICVDDGSTDGSLAILSDLQKEKPFLRVLVFQKNFGQSSAFDAGFKAARGEFVITMDADGQNDPADIPKLLETIGEADLVCGWRVNRKDPITKKVISFFANKIRGYICNDQVHDTGCSLKIYRRRCLDNIKLYNGMHRFLPFLFVLEGYQVKEVAVNHRERSQGVSKYNFFNRSIGPILDLFAMAWMKRRYLNYQIKEEIPQKEKI